MTFTDKDLQQLKEELPIAEHLGQLALRDNPTIISALIYRLESAEALLLDSKHYEIGFCSWCFQWPLHKDNCKQEVWRKAVGK